MYYINFTINLLLNITVNITLACTLPDIDSSLPPQETIDQVRHNIISISSTKLTSISCAFLEMQHQLSDVGISDGDALVR
jgi:uncharacterized ubiquitin-like protein YukD